MDNLMLSLQDWVILTSALGTAMSPAYYYLWQMKNEITESKVHLANVVAVIKHCPYCHKNGVIFESEDT